MKIIYIVFSCDEWKMTNSMRLVFATTSKQVLRRKLKTIIEKGDMSYTKGNPELPEKQQGELFWVDWARYGEEFVLNNIDYGFVSVVNDGEEQ